MTYVGENGAMWLDGRTQQNNFSLKEKPKRKVEQPFLPEVFIIFPIKIWQFQGKAIVPRDTIVNIELHGAVAMVMSHVAGLSTRAAVAEKQIQSVKATKKTVLGARFIFGYF